MTFIPNPIAIMLLRLLEDGFIDERQYEAFSENVMKKAKLFGFDNKLYVPTKCQTTLGNYIQQVNKTGLVCTKYGFFSKSGYKDIDEAYMNHLILYKLEDLY